MPDNEPTDCESDFLAARRSGESENSKAPRLSAVTLVLFRKCA
jgi:hypothetical protein